MVTQLREKGDRMHMIGRWRILPRALGAVGLLIAAAATVFAVGTAHAHATSAHHAVADNGVIDSRN